MHTHNAHRIVYKSMGIHTYCTWREKNIFMTLSDHYCKCLRTSELASMASPVQKDLDGLEVAFPNSYNESGGSALKATQYMYQK